MSGLVKRENPSLRIYRRWNRRKKKVAMGNKDSIRCEVLVPKDLVDDSGNYRENSLEIVSGLCENLFGT